MSGRDDAAAKKARGTAVTITLKAKKPFASAAIPMANACPDFPSGFIYCHQCSKKRDVTDAIQCTFLERVQSTRDKDKDKPPRERRCVAKFCKFCLKNRYDQGFDELVTSVRAAEFEQGHLESAGYIYKCPKCSETCNCPRCRKSKGLEPMGSAGTIRKPPEPAPKPPKQKADHKSKSKDPKLGPKAPKRPRTKPLPIVKWSSVPAGISLEDAEARFNIREFVLRFAHLFDPIIPKTNLDELEEIAGGRHQRPEDDDHMPSWVSEFCVKSIILALLNIIQNDLYGALAASIKQAVQTIKGLGVNFNKIWPVLSSLRESSLTLSGSPHQAHFISANPPLSLPGSSTPTIPFTFTFPEPLPLPTNHDFRAIRSTRNANDGLHILYTAQMVPIITSLIEDALLTSTVRDEIESGVREGKDTVRDQREAIKREGERWDQVRGGMRTHVKLKAQILENRAKREYHKNKLSSLDNSLKVLLPKYAPRMTPVGTDADSRIYWILSPGASEREAASDFIMSCSKDEKPMKRGGRKRPPKAKVLSSDERKEMRSWSWFVAVWGRKPEDAAGSALWKGKEKEKENGKGHVNGRSSVKLKIKVSQEKQKARGDDDAMDIDEPDHRDEDEEMASLSDQDSSSSRSSASSPSSSPSDSDNERSESSQSDQDDDDDANSVDQSETSEDDYDGDESNEDDPDVEKWWGFYDPLEILKLADWISIKACLDPASESDMSEQLQPSSLSTTKPLMTTTPLQLPYHPQHKDEVESRASSSTGTLIGVNGSGSTSTTMNGKKSRDTSVTVVSEPSSSSSITTRQKAQLKALVEELRTFASVLEWRCREDKYEVVLCDPVAAAGGSVGGSGGVVSAPGSVPGSVSASPVPDGRVYLHANGSGSVSVNGDGDRSAGRLKVRGGRRVEKEKESTGSVSVSSFYGTGSTR